MDINDLRAVTTVVSFALFVGILLWTLAGRRRAGFDEAAMLPFADPDDSIRTAGDKQ